ncbi:aldehyde dehydrogenase family protein [Glaciibacter superstes]|uniref:aldehyde dehydrogenase family protein n=1 Tax=Glaciibacter superstes TaxID=501023 RepID=UPI0003B6B9F4|nr:aldehyde dehydrogenase family protein [Glaciibacter superstes]
MTEPSPIRGLYIDGEWRETGVLDMRTDRWNGDTLSELQLSGAQEARLAVDAAAGAFSTGLSVADRSRILARVAAAITERSDEFAEAIQRETGKPISAARVEVARAAGTLAYAGEEARRLPGERVPLDAVDAGEGTLAVTIPTARGVVAAITPFNFPLNLVAHKVGPALAAGCPVVLKPSDKAPLAAILLVEAFESAGLPAGWLNLVHGPAEPIVDSWLDDDRVAVINFTGSAKIGWQLKARSPRKMHILELGSNSAMYVCADADLDRAVDDAVVAGFANSGQACISLQRLYLDVAIAEDFLARLSVKVSGIPFGDPLDESTIVGPLVIDEAAVRVGELIDAAVGAGARLLVAGARTGSVVAPTLLADVSDDDRVMRDELFGPVVAAATVTDRDDAVSRINDSQYGLNTSIYTREIAAALDFAGRIRSGSVLVNMPPSFRADHMPYGGVKDSGQGREGVRYAVAELVDMKLVVIKG